MEEERAEETMAGTNPLDELLGGISEFARKAQDHEIEQAIAEMMGWIDEGVPLKRYGDLLELQEHLGSVHGEMVEAITPAFIAEFGIGPESDELKLINQKWHAVLAVDSDEPIPPVLKAAQTAFRAEMIRRGTEFVPSGKYCPHCRCVHENDDDWEDEG